MESDWEAHGKFRGAAVARLLGEFPHPELLVACSLPYPAAGQCPLDALRLPDDTPFDEIGKRLVCEACGRRASRISVDWDFTASRPLDPRR